MRKCNLLIDSCCDLPQEIINVEGVDIIRFPYILNGASYDDDMFVNQSPHDFYEGMRKGNSPSTSQAPISRFKEKFEVAYESGMPTVYLSFTSALSTSFDNALLTRNQVVEEYPDFELYVVDTKLPSLAEGLLVSEAINQMHAGLSAKEMVEWVEEARYYVDAIFMVEDLKALQRGGRLPSGVAVAGSALDVKPFVTLTLDGGLKLAGVVRGRKKGIKQLASWFEKNVSNNSHGEYIAIGNADCKKDAEKLKDLILKHDSTAMILEGNIGPVIGSHVGPGMLAICYWSDDRRKNLSISDKIANKVKGTNN